MSPRLGRGKKRYVQRTRVPGFAGEKSHSPSAVPVGTQRTVGGNVEVGESSWTDGQKGPRVVRVQDEAWREGLAHRRRGEVRNQQCWPVRARNSGRRGEC